MLTSEQNLALRRFCQEITYRPRPLDQQPSERKGLYIWCEDWEMIEVVKYLFLGAETYFKETPPRRLRGNPLWSKEEIKDKAERLLHSSKRDISAIIELMRSIRNDPAPRLC